jgi:hypothetical protein
MKASDGLAGRQAPKLVSPEHHRLGSIDENTLFGVPADSTCEHTRFDILTRLDKLESRAIVTNPLDILLDDRSFVEIVSHIMRRRADDLDPAFMRLVIWFGPFEARQKAVMDIDATPGKYGGELA